MTAIDPSSDTVLSRRWFLSPGFLFTVTLVLFLASVGVWVRWRAHRQQARLEYLKQIPTAIWFPLGVETEPVHAVWLHDLVLATLGEEFSVGFTDITGIDLTNASVTDADLQYLSRLKNVRSLNLSSTSVTDDGLAHVKGLASLQSLSLGYTQVSDAGLRHLSGLTHLEELDLDNTQVTDAGLQHLGGLTRLEVLILRDTEVTSGGIDALQSELPGVEVRH